MEENKTIAICSCGGNNVTFYIVDDGYAIHAEPGELNSYEISIEKVYDDGEETIFMYRFVLTEEEFKAALDSSYEDWMFVEDVDSLVSKRAARDIFKHMIKATHKQYGHVEIDKELCEKWEKYAKYLIHERMEGRTIAAYHPGFEPEDNNA